jgi:hypothetical protein
MLCTVNIPQVREIGLFCIPLDANADMNSLRLDVCQNFLLFFNEKYSYSVAYLSSISRGKRCVINPLLE